MLMLLLKLPLISTGKQLAELAGLGKMVLEQA